MYILYIYIYIYIYLSIYMYMYIGSRSGGAMPRRHKILMPIIALNQPCTGTQVRCEQARRRVREQAGAGGARAIGLAGIATRVPADSGSGAGTDGRGRRSVRYVCAVKLQALARGVLVRQRLRRWRAAASARRVSRGVMVPGGGGRGGAEAGPAGGRWRPVGETSSASQVQELPGSGVLDGGVGHGAGGGWEQVVAELRAEIAREREARCLQDEALRLLWAEVRVWLYDTCVCVCVCARARVCVCVCVHSHVRVRLLACTRVCRCECMRPRWSALRTHKFQCIRM